MSPRRRDRAPLAAVLCTALGCCAPAPASAAAGTGGAQIPLRLPQSLAAEGYGKPGARSLLVAPTALVGRAVPVRGTLPGAARRRIVLQRLDARRGWRTVARARVRSTERFELGFRAARSGPTSLRVVLRSRVRAAASAPVATIVVYRPAMATLFGPGLYGNATFCGQPLTPILHGVAHRTLPCGTPVAILFDHRQIVVPVVDRGPFHAGFDWDLTQATADALGFTGSGAIGYVRAPPKPPT